MTKEEIRHISICKLCLQADSVLYDVGSGTGSIAVEAAALSEDLSVYAIEQKENAVALIRKNAEQFGLENIHIVHAKAPEGMDELPAPTHAFIGGSGGNLREILTCLRGENPGIRIVINADLHGDDRRADGAAARSRSSLWRRISYSCRRAARNRSEPIT